jgi:hypothetical protein
MPRLFSRKQFFIEALHRGLRAFCRWFDGDPEGSEYTKDQRSSELSCISADFSPALLHLEAERLGINPKSCVRENLLRAVYEAMESQQSKHSDNNDYLS